MMNDPIESASVSRPFFAAPRLVTGIVLIAALLVSIAAILAILKLNKNDPISSDEFAEMLGWNISERRVDVSADKPFEIKVGWRDQDGKRHSVGSVNYTEGLDVMSVSLLCGIQQEREVADVNVALLIRNDSSVFRSTIHLPFTATESISQDSSVQIGLGGDGYSYDPKPPAPGEYWLRSFASPTEQQGADLGFWIEP